MAVQPAHKPKIVKKRTKKFIRHQSDRYDKVKVRNEQIIIECNRLTINIFYFFRKTGGSQRVLTIAFVVASRVNT